MQEDDLVRSRDRDEDKDAWVEGGQQVFGLLVHIIDYLAGDAVNLRWVSVFVLLCMCVFVGVCRSCGLCPIDEVIEVRFHEGRFVE